MESGCGVGPRHPPFAGRPNRAGSHGSPASRGVRWDSGRPGRGSPENVARHESRLAGPRDRGIIAGVGRARRPAVLSTAYFFAPGSVLPAASATLAPPRTGPAPAVRPRRAKVRTARTRLYHGWVMLPLAAALHAGTGVGQTYGISVFVPHVLRDLGLTTTGLSVCYMIASLAAAAPLPWVGRWADRAGLRRTAAAAVVGLVLACAATAGATGAVTLTAGFFLLRLLGPGALSLVAANTVPMWFSRRLGLAAGLVGVGQSLAFAALPPLYAASVLAVGWRAALPLLGFASAAVLLPALALIYRDRPADVGRRIDGDGPERRLSRRRPKPAARSYTAREARRTSAFRATLFAQATWGMIGTGVLFHAVTILSCRGLSETAAASLFTPFGLLMAAGLGVGGALADRLPARRLIAASALLSAAGTALLCGVDTVAGAWLVGGLLGLGQGVLCATLNTAWPRFFGTEHLGAVRGTAQTVSAAACAVGPVLVGFSQDCAGDARPALAASAALLLGVAATARWVRPPSA